MRRMVFLACGSVLLVEAIVGPDFGGGTTASAFAATPYRFELLDDTMRDRIDESARNATPEKSKTRLQVEVYGDSTAFLISRLALPEGEETRLAEREHQKLSADVPILETPESVQKIFDALIDQIPENLIPAGAAFSLTVVDDDSRHAFTLGGGQIYLGREYLNALFVDPETDRERLAFALAHELGHVCRGHVRRRYQMQWMVEQAEGLIDDRELSRLKAAVKKTFLRTAGKGLSFAFSLEEDMQADRFAWHLCRNAGFGGKACFDCLRERALETVAGDSERLDEIQRKYQIRMQELLSEREGTFADPEYGLRRFVPETGELLALEPNSIEAGQRAIVFVHGMESNPLKFRELAASLAGEERILLAYHYPNDGSLARAGIALTREIQRVTDDSGNWDFVCHSAGGLVFRWYAEVESGSFRRAVMLGTPQHGSSLSRLRAFLEVAQFLGNLKLGYTEALQAAILDSKGQIAEDLRRESLFLRYLNRHRPEVESLRERCAIVRGQAMGRRTGFVLQGSVKAGKLVLERKLRQKEMHDLLKDQLLAGLEKVDLPEEISHGDLAVTLESAELAGVSCLETLRCNHIKLIDDEAVGEILKEFLGIAD